MSEPRILLFGPALNIEETRQRLDMLRELEIPSAVKFVAATGKIDTTPDVKSFKVEAAHPPEPAYLQTLSAWAELPYSTEPRFRDGFDLFCLRTLLAKEADFEHAVLLRNAVGFQEGWAALVAEAKDKLFLTFQGGSADSADHRQRHNLLLNLRAEYSKEFIDLAWRLCVDGATFGIASYSLEKSLGMAEEGLRLAQGIP